MNIENRIREIAERKEALRKMVKLDVFKPGIHFQQFGHQCRLLLSGVQLLKELHQLCEVDRKVVHDSVEGGHRIYEVHSTVRSIDGSGGSYFGTGVRVCSTMEPRFLHEFKNTNKRPEASWFRDKNMLDLPGNTPEDPYRFTVRTSNGKAFIYERVPTENPAKHYNVVAALACKRAQMAAVIDAIGATDLFEVEGEILPADYIEHLDSMDQAEGADAKNTDSEEAQSDLDLRFAAVCEAQGDAVTKLLRKTGRISENETWKDLKGDNRSKVLENITFLEEKFGSPRAA